MEENSKKRSKKTKLVPRQYLDSDDENIAFMEQEIEEELANIRAQSLLKKLNTSSVQPKTELQFSVNEEYDEELTDEKIFSTYNDLFHKNVEKLDSTIVKPEDCITETTSANKNKEGCITETTATTGSSNKEKDENLSVLSKNLEKDKGDEIAQDFNIRIESVRSLKNTEKLEVSCYKITKSMIKEEFEIFSRNTTSNIDKKLEIHIRNYFGHYIPEFKLNRTEVKIQEVFNKWRKWLFCDPLVRDTPLMYICSSCRLAWWYLNEFREHISYHRKFVFDLYTEKHKSYIIIACTKRELRYHEVAIGTNCWKCGKDVTHHKEQFFDCAGCENSFETCLLLSMHEGSCEDNRKFYQKASENTYVEFQCPVCPYKHWKEEELLKHLLGLHSVRSDLPVYFTPTKCVKCKQLVNNIDLHLCTLGPAKEPCGFCFRKFRNKTNLLVHKLASANNFKCRVCKKQLEKACMEFEHLLEHTDSYKMLYMCLVCKDSPCFLDLHSVKYHRTDYHKNNEKANENYCQVVVPKSLLKRFQPMKMLVQPPPDPEENDKLPEVQTVDSEYESLLETTNNTVENTSQKEVEIVNVTDEDFESNIQITIINKNTVQKIVDSIPSEEVIEVIKNTKKENVEDVNDNNETTSVHNNNKNNDDSENTCSRTKSKTGVESEDVGNVNIKDELIEIDESNGINEINETNKTNDTNLTGNNDINIQNEMNDDTMNSVCETIDDVDLPVNLENEEESYDSYEDGILVINKNVSNSTTLGKKRKEDKSNGAQYIDKSMWPIHNEISRYLCTKCDSTYSSFRTYLMHFVIHDYNPLTCPKCMKQMTTHYQLLCHVNFHIKYSFVSVHTIGNDLSDNTNKFQCKKCHQVLGFRDFFKHWESHLNLQSVSEHVSTQFTVNMDGKPNLKEMLTLLTDPFISTYWCMECAKTFGKKDDLKRHFIVHLLKDAYAEINKHGCLKCQICGQKFNCNNRYKRHLREHASLPIYKCEYCDKVFSDSSNFSKHKKVHNLSVLICNICKKFQKRPYLNKHLEVVEPKSRVQPMKMLVQPPPDPEENDKTPEVQTVDSECECLLETTNNTVENTSQKEVEIVNKTDEDFESNIQITIINKNTVQKIVDSIPSEEVIEVIKNTKKENVEDVNDNNETTSVHNNNKNNDDSENTCSRTKSKTGVESEDVGNVLIDRVTVDVSHIKDELMEIDESNGINEINETNKTNDTNLTGNNDINIQNEMNDDTMNSVCETIDDVDLPVNLENEEESDDSYEDGILVINKNVSNSTTLRKKRKEDKSNGAQYIDKSMWPIHNEISRYLCTKCDSTHSSFRKYLMHFVIHDYNPLTCPKCMKQMTTHYQLLCHVNFHIKYSFVSVHTIGNNLSDNKDKYQCKKCHQVLGFRDFFEHWESHLNLQSVSEHVSTQFTVNMDGKPNLKEMLILLTDPFMPTNWCMECAKTFRKKNDLKRHFIVHLLKDAYAERNKHGCLKCQICGQEFNSSDGYRGHLREHASLPIYKCEYCDKAYSDSSDFSKHKKIHKLSVMICDICKKKFQKRPYLIKHLKVHSEEKFKADNNNKNDKNNDDSENTCSRTKSKTGVESEDVGNVLIDRVTVDVSHIKDEPMEIDESNGINEINETNKTNDTNLTGNNDINKQNEMNDDTMNSVCESIDDVDLPVNLENEEESDDSYEDGILVISKNVSNSTILRKKRKEDRSNGAQYIDKSMWLIHKETSRYLCTKCDSTYSSFRKYLMHFVIHDYNPLTCPKCMKPMTNHHQLLCHVNFHIKYSFVSVHTIGNDLSDNKDKYQCKKCHQVLGFRDFFEHWESHLNLQSVSEHVSTQFTVNMDGKPKLKKMLILLTDPFMPTNWCMECAKTFGKKNDLKKHFIVHLLKDAYAEINKHGCLKCQICGQKFNSSNRYKRHLREHASLPIYKCEYCDKAFSDSSHFSKHKKIHNLSVMICDICKKKFQKRPHLIKHLQMHEVRQPIVCKTCNKTFYSQSVYSKHLKRTGHGSNVMSV